MDLYPPDLLSPVGRTRKYIPDLVPLEDPRYPEREPQYYFSDIEILAYVGEYAQEPEGATRIDIKRAAADIIDALANNEALVLKKIVTEDLQTDGPATANALRAGARALRAQADEEEAAANVTFSVIPFQHYHPRTRLVGRYR